MKLNVNDDYFDYVKKNPECKIVVYGAGNEARKRCRQIGHIDYFCDQRAKSIGMINKTPCLLPEELKLLEERLIVLICIKEKKLVNEICVQLEKILNDAEIFSFFENPSFEDIYNKMSCPESMKARFDKGKYKYCFNERESLKIRIVYKSDGWILGKFAENLEKELLKLGQMVDIAPCEDLKADINHFIIYENLSIIDKRADSVRTTMITHVNCLKMLEQIKYQAENNVVGICMSSDTLRNLSAFGVPRDKLCYVNPAHDAQIRPKKIVLGITNRRYDTYDMRKREDLILQVCKQLNPLFFKLKIMGSGWDETVNQLKNLGYEVDYYDEFNKELYIRLMSSLDYWIFSGFDEGGMGYLDALAAGVKTIVTPQGFHLDAKEGLTYPCSTIDDFIRTLEKFQQEKKKIIDTVKEWTWENYAKKHLEIWQYLTRSKSLKDLYAHQGEYMDGIFSLLVSDISV